ncbi:MAG: Hsp33 family molecular chaperone HslO, partial [Clostridia bacterium]|nr:Hsp33 family molecular chaperone HslO [Clostridia bacterium]
MDTLIKTIAHHKMIRAYAAVTTDLVNRAASMHQTMPVGTAALGRALTAVGMMGAMLKEPGETVSIQFKGGGPLGSVFAMSEFGAKVRGYVDNPLADLPLNARGKLDVGSAVGVDGTLSVVRQLSVGEPYVGQIPL